MTDAIRSLRTINLNLLPVLAELLRCRNVTHAASILNLTQSTVSGALRQLREILGDPILVQRGREMHLTERARDMIPEVENLVELASRLLQAEEFDPATARTNFQIATADYLSALIASQVGRLLQTCAPNVSLTLLPTPGSSAKSLIQGTLDLIICPNRRSNLQSCGISLDEGSFELEVFKREQWLAIQCAGHPSAGRDLDILEYFERPHATYFRTDGRNTIEQDTLDTLGITQRNSILIPYFTLLPQTVVGSDLISLIPQTLAEHYSEIFHICTFRPPFELPPLESAMIWAKNRESSPSLRWLRSIVRNACGAIDGKQCLLDSSRTKA